MKSIQATDLNLVVNASFTSPVEPATVRARASLSMPELRASEHESDAGIATWNPGTQLDVEIDIQQIRAAIIADQGNSLDLDADTYGDRLLINQTMQAASMLGVQRGMFPNTLSALRSGGEAAAISAFDSDLRNADGLPIDIHALVQWVIRESYTDTLQDLAYHAEKVRTFNEMKKAVRDQLGFMREIRAKLAGINKDDAATTSLSGAGPTASPGVAGSLSTADLVTHPMDVFVGSADQRLAAYPQMAAKVAKLMVVEDLHALFKADKGAQNEFLATIPYFTQDELKTMLQRFGGSDLSGGDFGQLWRQVVARMTPGQMLDIEKDPPLMTAVIGRTEVKHRRMHGAKVEFYKTYHPKTGPISGLVGPQDFGKGVVRTGSSAFRIAFQPEFAEAQTLIRAKLGLPASANADQLREAWQSYAERQLTPRTNESGAGPESTLPSSENGKEGLADLIARSQKAATASPSSALRSEPVDKDAGDGSIDDVQVTSQPPYLMRTGKKVSTVAELDAAIEKMEEALNSVGDDAQLANVDLQNILQKSQQSLQMLSNCSKSFHETAMAVIRNMAG